MLFPTVGWGLLGIGGVNRRRGWTDILLLKKKKDESLFLFSVFLEILLNPTGLDWNDGEDRIGLSVGWVRGLYNYRFSIWYEDI